MFLFVLFIIKPEVYKFDFSKSLLDEHFTVILALFVIAVLSVVFSFVLKNFLINKAVQQQNVRLVQTALIVACSLAEIASLLGFVLAISFAYPYFFIFFIFGIGVIILHFPLRKNFIDASYKTTMNNQL
jgi:hypothetical protein